MTHFSHRVEYGASAFFPKAFWAGFIGVIVLMWISGSYEAFYSSLINFFIIFLFLKVGIVIHEIGHLVFAKIAGGEPCRMVLGRGHEVARWTLFRIKIIVRSSLHSGLAFATFRNETRLRWRYGIFVCGGFVSNLLAAALVASLWNIHVDVLSGKSGIDPASSFVFANILLVFTTLMPSHSDYAGIKLPSDGLVLSKLFSMNMGTLEERIAQNELFDANDYYEEKAYDRALAIYENHSRSGEPKTYIQINRSLVYIKKGEYDRALQILEETLTRLYEKEQRDYEAWIHNNLAWLYLLQNDVERADTHSEKALELHPKEMIFQETRGAVLIEKGESERGIGMLQKPANLRFATNDILVSAMFLALGYFFLHEVETAVIYYDFVAKNSEKLDADGKHFWERIRGSIEGTLHPSASS